MWPFNVAKPKPRYIVVKNGYGKYKVTAGPGFRMGLDAIRPTHLSDYTFTAEFDSMEDAEKAVQEFEEYITKRTFHSVKEIL